MIKQQRNIYVSENSFYAKIIDNKPCGCDVETEIYPVRSRKTLDNSTFDNLFDMIHRMYVTARTQTKFRSVKREAQSSAKVK